MKKNTSKSAETASAPEKELESVQKMELTQTRWQASGEGYVGSVETKDPDLYNQLRTYSPLEITWEQGEEFWLG
ncbi:MAG: hypothetical protein HQM15_04740 [Deltaproteobacteria bacterium]|nr:hypothetical protein [Deltaproteobacteria bacterium]